MKHILTIATLGMLAACSGLAADFSSWGYKASITFSGYGKTETLTNFPTLVQVGTNISGYTPSQSLCPVTNGCDLRFTAADGTTELNYEKELWSTSTLTNSIFWVQVPLLTNNASIVAYWGKSTNSPAYTTNGAVWVNRYVGVWHLREPSNGPYYDSTSNRVNSTGGTASQVAGEAGYGQLFNGNSDLVDFTSSAALNNQSVTVEFWINPSPPAQAITALLDYDHASTPSQGWVVQSEDATGAGNYYFGYYDGAAFQPSGGIGTGKGVQIVNAQWQHIAYTKAGTTVTGYRNGASIWAPGAATSSTVSYGSGRNVRLGRTVWSATPQRYAKGTFDEVRISSAARSANWVWAEYQNMASNTVFQAYGAETAQSSGDPAGAASIIQALLE